MTTPPGFAAAVVEWLASHADQLLARRTVPRLGVMA